LRCLVVFLLVCCSLGLRAQLTSPPPDALLDAGHCLAAADRDWLDIARENPYRLELGYSLSDPSDAERSQLILIEYTKPTHSEGFAYSFETRGKEQHRVFLLQYRIRFHQTDDGTARVNLVDPPLGGIGTQDEVVDAIRQIGFHTWTVPVDDLRKHSSSAHCDTSAAAM
jgi:hypothetical protein